MAVGVSFVLTHASPTMTSFPQVNIGIYLCLVCLDYFEAPYRIIRKINFLDTFSHPPYRLPCPVSTLIFMHWVDSTLRTKLTYIKIKVVLINVLPISYKYL
jgi:hypothetical protein